MIYYLLVKGGDGGSGKRLPISVEGYETAEARDRALRPGTFAVDYDLAKDPVFIKDRFLDRETRLIDRWYAAVHAHLAELTAGQSATALPSSAEENR